MGKVKTLIGNIKGPKGEQGETGATGERGTGIWFCKDTPAYGSETSFLMWSSNDISSSIRPAISSAKEFKVGDKLITADGLLFEIDEIFDELSISVSYVASIVGPAGSQGEKGDTGERGTGIWLYIYDNFVGNADTQILASYISSLSPTVTATTDVHTGDKILTANGWLYEVTDVTSAQISMSPISSIVGPQGAQGPTGATGTRGSRWTSGSAITGTFATDTVCSETGIADALVNDQYLNPDTGDIYRCTLGGDADTATWVWSGNLNSSGISDLASDIALNRQTLGYSKKNLLKNTATTSTVNGVTFTVNEDGSITANGTATATIYLHVADGFKVSKSGRYILSGCPANGSLSSYEQALSLYDSDSGTASTTLYRDFGEEVEMELETSTKYVLLNVIVNGMTVENLTFYPMIREATITDGTYESYVDDVDTRLDALTGSNGNIKAAGITQTRANYTIVSSIGWYRAFVAIDGQNWGHSIILHIVRGYYNLDNECYDVAIDIAFGGKISFTQLSGMYNIQQIDKIRVHYIGNSYLYIDVHVKLVSTNGITVYGEGTGTFQKLKLVEDVPESGTTIEFELTKGVKTNIGFTGDLTGNASTATADASGNVITDTYATKTELEELKNSSSSSSTVDVITGELGEFDEGNTVGSKDLNDITYGNNKFVTVSSSGATYYSTDGINWTAGGTAGSGNLRGVTYGDGKFVTVSSSGTTYYSEDGINWTAGGEVDDQFKAITYGNDKFVAIGVTYIWYSEDGITWTAGSEVGDRTLSSVTYGNGKYVTVGKGIVSWYSEDGITWTDGSTVTFAYHVTFGNGKFVATGNTGAYYSEDGITWAAGSHNGDVDGDGIITDDFDSLTAVTFGNGRFIATDMYGTTYYSEDGINWVVGSDEMSSYPNYMAYGSNIFVGVGDSGFTCYLEHIKETKSIEDAINELYSQTINANAILETI